MKGGKRPLGYTIIEVMIVLAISGLMFLIAASFIGDKQQTTTFTEGVNQMASQIQNTIQQVTNGQYSDVGLNCVTGCDSCVAGTNTQGTNSQCVFMGKLIRFSNIDNPNYEVISLAGDQLDPSTLSASTTPQQVLTLSHPAIVGLLTTSETIQQQLDIVGMSITDANGTVHKNIYYNIGFIQNLGTPNGVGSFQSGSQPISLVYSPVLSAPPQPDTSINNNVDYAQSATICLSDGTDPARDLLAKITIGSNSDQFGVTVQHLSPGAACP